MPRPVEPCNRSPRPFRPRCALFVVVLASQSALTVQVASAAVDRVGSWTSELLFQTNGFSYAPGAGSNRVALIMITAESTTSPVANMGSVTLGGQTLTAIQNGNGVVVGSAGGYHNFVWLGYLDEARIRNMSGSALAIVWDTTPNQPDGGEVKVQAATYQNVDQATPIAASASNTNTSASTIQAGSVSVGEGDRLVYVTVHGNVGNHTAPAGYTEQIEQDGPGSDHSNASAERDATTAGAQNPTATWDSSWRVAIISVVLNQTCYTESVQTWSATSADAWQTQSLAGAPFNVPANAVVEVVVRNSDDFNELWGGVRAVGSSLERRFLLQEAEDGGSDRVTLHVQANASSQIQHYADTTADVTFILAGYWTCGTYVERYDTFTAGASGSWQDRELCAYGVRPGHVAEVVMTNDDSLLSREVGVRTSGSSLERRVPLRNAEASGVDAVSMMVEAGTSAEAMIELYAQDDADVDFYLVGYWSAAPKAYAELFVDVGSPTLDATWTDLDLTASGVPADALTEFVLGNEYADEENSLGVRPNGSSLNRTQQLVEAEDGGADTTTTHVNADADAVIEFYHQDVSDSHTFWLIGYWTTCDTSIAYVATDLGAVTGSNSSLGWHINSAEKVAGFEEDADGNADAWFQNCGSFTSLGTLGGSYAEAHGVNNADMVVGWSHNAGGSRRAFRWTSAGGMVDLGTVSGRTDSEALSVNASSEIVGTVVDFGSPSYNRLAFLYLPSTAYGLGSGMNSLGTLGGTQSLAMDISDSGRVVGGAQNAGGNFRPFRWNSGTMTDLGTLGGDSTHPDHRAEAVNSSGNICGRSYTSGGAARAFFWNGSMSNLGVLTGGSESWAFGLNDSNIVVGTSGVTGGAFHAFVWDSTNGMRDLNNLLPGGSGWTLIRATDINNDGFITGWGTNGSGDTRAFLLTPTCAAGGGGAAATAPSVLASGAGVTDELGEFSDLAVDVDLRPLAAVEVIADEPGIRVEYELIDPTLSAGAGRQNPANGAGFADGLAFARTLTVSTSATNGDLSITVSMTFTVAEIRALGAAPEDLELHVLDPASGSTWSRAGRSVGRSEPTGVPGESGFMIYDDDTVDYWAERDSVGVFAVGRAAAESPVEPPPGPRPCGIAMIQPLLLCLMGLLFLGGARRV